MKTAFILGAGSSIPAGLPSTAKITRQILSGQNIIRHTDGNYYERIPPLDTPDLRVQKILKFLKRLRHHATAFYSGHRALSVNYEDIAHLAIQIRDYRLEVDNPAVQPFVDLIWPDLQDCRMQDNGTPAEETEPGGLFYEAVNYISCMTWGMVTSTPSRYDHLNCLLQACADQANSSIDVFTLNHDTVIEQCLMKHSVSYVDGFSDPIKGVRYWRPTLYDAPITRARLFKLHGSANWFRFPDNSATGRNPYGIPTSGDFFHTKGPDGKLQWPQDGRPEVLIGTINKMLAYNSGIYAELQQFFYQRLLNATHLVIAGYGFGDKGINSRIIDWMRQSASNTIQIIEPDVEACSFFSRPTIRHWMAEWCDKGRCEILQCGIESTGWQGGRIHPNQSANRAALEDQ